MEKRTGKKPIKKQEPLFPEIIVKFREGGPLEEKEGQLYARHLSLENFTRILKSVKGAIVVRSFRGDTDRLQKMQTQASISLKRPLPNLSLFVRVRLIENADIEALVRQFADDPDVEYACIAGIPAPPPQTPDFTGQQDYQDMAPDGVDAQYAWFFPGGDGTGIQMCDCEYGFNPNHEDLPAVTVVSNRDGDLAQYESHGTAVLGELGAISDAKGVTGTCRGATFMFASESGGHRLDCIKDAILALNAGDILVLEMQAGPAPYKPAEYDPDIHAWVSTAVGLGIVVVAAAGNGSIDLTTTADANGKFIWDPASPDYNDSGAIIVGAGGSTSNQNPHSKLSFSDYGARVNCQGWGQDVVTTGHDGGLYNGGVNAQYTSSFNGTSSATPIVAGVVACLQGAALQALGAPLTPAAVRTLVSDPINGTPQADSAAYPASTNHIGPLPDLRRVMRAAEIFADVYMRDNVADTGIEPYLGGVLCWSPDIIVRKSPVADPSTAFGLATWGDANLGEKIEFGQNNYIYVRMYNRGNAPDNIEVSVYWTDASGFLVPATWNLLGILNVNNVFPGEHRVAGPITWPKAQVPPVGHYCLIAVVNSQRDPISIPGALATVDEYLSFVRNHNNICYRNSDVEDALPDVPTPPYTFLLRGLPSKSARFRMEVRHRLPQGAEIQVEIAMQLPKLLPKERGGVIRPIQIQHLPAATLFKLNKAQPLIINEMVLKRNAAVPVNIRVKMPKDVQNGEYLIFADQYLGKMHLGRVNYTLRVGKSRPKKKGEK